MTPLSADNTGRGTGCGSMCHKHDIVGRGVEKLNTGHKYSCHDRELKM